MSDSIKKRRGSDKTVKTFIGKNKLGVPTGRTKKSGFCTYPEVKFDIARIKELGGK